MRAAKDLDSASKVLVRMWDEIAYDCFACSKEDAFDRDTVFEIAFDKAVGWGEIDLDFYLSLDRDDRELLKLCSFPSERYCN